MGFPLHKGSVCDGILTCHWHHARFDLESGGTFDPWADDVQTYDAWSRTASSTSIPARAAATASPTPRRGCATAWSRTSAWSWSRTCSPCSRPSVAGQRDPGDRRPLRRDLPPTRGWRSGLTILTAMGNILPAPAAGGPDAGALPRSGPRRPRLRRAAAPLRPRPAAGARRAPAASGSRPGSASSSRCATRDGAERALLTAIARRATRPRLADMLASGGDRPLLPRRRAHPRLRQQGVRAARSDRLGRGGDAILPSLVPGLADGAALRGAEHLAPPGRPGRPAGAGASPASRRCSPRPGATPTGRAPDALIETLLGDDPEAIVAALSGALAAGAPLDRGQPGAQLRGGAAGGPLPHQQRVQRLDHRPPHLHLRQRPPSARCAAPPRPIWLRGRLPRRDAALPRPLPQHPGRAAAGGAAGRRWRRCRTTPTPCSRALRDLLDREQQVQAAGLRRPPLPRARPRPGPADRRRSATCCCARTASSTPTRCWRPGSRCTASWRPIDPRGREPRPRRRGPLPGRARPDQPVHAADGPHRAPPATRRRPDRRTCR